MLLVLLVAFLAYGLYNYPCRTGPAKIVVTRAYLKQLHGAVNMFKLDTGRYPLPEKGLIELVQKPDDVTGWAVGGYLLSTDIPLDVWKNEFIYIRLNRSDLPFFILSFGADGKPGGTGENADLYSTELE
jgi:general secretion pathway protein G